MDERLGQASEGVDEMLCAVGLCVGSASKPARICGMDVMDG
jgi:hypothetical protein